MKQPLFRQAVVDRLSSPDDLDQLSSLASPRSWLLLVALSSVLVAVGCWSVFGSILVTVSGKGLLAMYDSSAEQFAGVLYIPFDEAGRIHPGMPIQLAPLTGDNGQSIPVQGLVNTVGALPATHSQMVTSLGNEEYARLLAEQGALIEVGINVDARSLNSHTAASDAWQTNRPVAGTITVAKLRPLSYVFPNN